MARVTKNDFAYTDDWQAEFNEFWATYPRKTAKPLARKAFDKAIKKTTLSVMLMALKWQKQSEQWLGGFIPHPSTWLNQERWDDEPPPPSLNKKNARAVRGIFGDDPEF